jgi:phosphoribosylaminoimidazole-succinocarboxamide synthase
MTTMLSEHEIRRHVAHAFAGITDPAPDIQGKVRDIYLRPGKRILVTTDRLSAFDRVLGLVPFKGQVLNQLSAFWFQTLTEVGNHLLATPDPNITVARECRALPVEVIVRGYITGVTSTALWYRYSLGERSIYGYTFPDGLKKNDRLPEAIITPTTKGGPGQHDERLTVREVTEKGILPAALWDEVQKAALAVFRRGQEIAADGGLILVDTKYEFGLTAEGKLALIDEVHTPDSSRFWRADSYARLFAAGEEPENFDKEFLRLWYAERGYRGDGEPPVWDTDLAVLASQRYVAVYEMLTGKPFAPAAYPADKRVAQAILSV